MPKWLSLDFGLGFELEKGENDIKIGLDDASFIGHVILPRAHMFACPVEWESQTYHVNA